MDHARFETLKREIAAHATVDQLIDLEAQTARDFGARMGPWRSFKEFGDG